MNKFLCIHGHFYQPPRFDPWLDDILPEASAAPSHDWNERIARQCYTPLAFARRLDSSGRITELLNCYAWMSFNFGPTLLRWLELHAPATYARILEADRHSLARLGYGNALAQVYHHVIMPLATDLDKDLEIGWAIQDFTARFGRPPEGMWLAETAVDLPTLSALAQAGIKFTILAPRQARAVRLAGNTDFTPITEDGLDTTRPYLVHLPQGKSISVFFYDGPIARAVAFERLLEDGEQFWARLSQGLSGGLRHLATDGESYGHHFPFGEMALAYVFDQARQGRDGILPTNYATYLAAHPATDEALIHENSSWSCVHGLERWKTHCGCSNGDHPDWIQDWRRPLRRGFNYLKYYTDEHYSKVGRTLFQDAGQALAGYGLVLSGQEGLSDFLARQLVPGASGADQAVAARLLAMQRASLASFASCAWFFDDLARLEPLLGLTNARRALDLLLGTGGPDVEEGFVRILHEAQSNQHEHWDGEFLWQTQITPRRPDVTVLARLAQITGNWSWPGLDLAVDGGLVRARWTQTLEEETVPQNNDQVTDPLDPRHAAALARAVSFAAEQDLWAATSLAATRLAPYLRAFGEGQHAPQAFLDLLLPGLAWNFLLARTDLALDLPPDVLKFMARWLVQNPNVGAVLEQRVEALGLELVRGLPETRARFLDLVRHVALLGLGVHWWECQNVVMEKDQKDEDLCLALGLAPGR